MTLRDMNETPERPDGSSEPTHEFTQPVRPPGPGHYPGPSGPPPAGQPWLFGDTAQSEPTTPYAAPAPAKADRRRRGGLAAAVVAASLVIGGGAGFGGAALWHATQEDESSSVFSTTAGDGSTKTSAPAPTGSVQGVAATVLPSVVKIEVAGSQGSGSGSGIIVSSDGLIITNHHVIDVASDNGKIRVDFNDGSSASATVVGSDPLTDTAVIKAQDVSGLKPATMGKSDDLAVGQQVVAIGSPFGLDSTVTTGIVSALNRPVNVGSDGAGNATVYPAIQTDAAINPGNSGGALVDMDGHVVGINASIRTTAAGGGEAGSIGLGFAIPIDEVGPVIQQMIDGETPTHARLGITVRDVGAGEGQGQQPQSPGDGFPFDTPDQQPEGTSPFQSKGAEVREVSNGSAADEAGIKPGDIILKVDDHLIVGSDSLVATVRSYRPGDEVEVTYTRGGDEHTVTLKLDSDAGAAKS